MACTEERDGIDIAVVDRIKSLNIVSVLLVVVAAIVSIDMGIAVVDDIDNFDDDIDDVLLLPYGLRIGAVFVYEKSGMLFCCTV